MPHYQRVGDIPPKRHTQFRAPDGDLYAEDLMGSEGFSSSSSLLYHRRPPTAIVGAETVNGAAGAELRPNEPLLPRHLRTADLPETADLVTGRHLLLANDDLRLSVARPTGPSGLYRNATGDEIVYLDAAEEGQYTIAQASETFDFKTGKFEHAQVLCRSREGEAVMSDPKTVDYMDVDPAQIVSAPEAVPAAPHA